VCQKSDTHVNYVNIMPYKVKKHQIFTLFEQFQHSLLLIHRVVLNVSTLLLYDPNKMTTPFVNAAVTRSMKRCDNLFHSSTMACFSWSTVVNFWFAADEHPKQHNQGCLETTSEAWWMKHSPLWDSYRVFLSAPSCCMRVHLYWRQYTCTGLISGI